MCQSLSSGNSGSNLVPCEVGLMLDCFLITLYDRMLGPLISNTSLCVIEFYRLEVAYGKTFM
jgi:hypothetical protein